MAPATFTRCPWPTLPARLPSRRWAATQGPWPGLSNDGAACIGTANVDLGIAKAGPVTVAPSGTISWTLTVTNDGPGNSSAFSVSDPVPAGVTNVATTTAGCSAAGNQVSCSEGALSNGSTFTIVVTGKAPSTEGTCLTNTATVNGNEVDPNSGQQQLEPADMYDRYHPGQVGQPDQLHRGGPDRALLLRREEHRDGEPRPMSPSPTTSWPPLRSIAAAARTSSPPWPPPPRSPAPPRTQTTLADVSGGSISNTGTAVGTPTGGANVSATSSVTIPYSHITLAKSANPTSFTAAGQTITYSYLVTDTGTTTVNALSVTDPMPGLSAINCGGTTSLAPLASVTCTATYTTTAGDVSNGSIANTGTATGTDQDGNPVGATSSVTIPYSATAPNAPTGVKAVTGRTTTTTGSLTVTYTPGPDNGSTFTQFTATCTSTNGGATKTGTHSGATAAPITVTRVTTKKTYRCTVAATNTVGTGPASAASAPVIVGSPAAPSKVKAVSGSTTATTGSLRVTFTLGANSGSAISSQTATCASSNGGVTKTGTHRGANAASITVTGVTTGKTYTCTVAATNARGRGLASARSLPVVVGSPAVPTRVAATHVAAGQIKVTFTPGSDDGSRITGYTASCTSSNGGVLGAESGRAAR